MKDYLEKIFQQNFLSIIVLGILVILTSILYEDQIDVLKFLIGNFFGGTVLIVSMFITDLIIGLHGNMAFVYLSLFLIVGEKKDFFIYY